MKYIKLFEKINFDDIDFEEDWEEEDPDVLIPKVGDIYIRKDFVRLFWWDSNRWDVYYLMRGDDLVVSHVKHVSEIDHDGYGEIKKGSIPHNGYMVKFEGKWPWFRIDDNVNESKKYLKYFENIEELDPYGEEDWDEMDKSKFELLEKYYVHFKTNDECIEIAKKLKGMGYGVYNYEIIMEEGSDQNRWNGFVYTVLDWSRTSINSDFREPIGYVEFMKIIKKI